MASLAISLGALSTMYCIGHGTSPRPSIEGRIYMLEAQQHGPTSLADASKSMGNLAQQLPKILDGRELVLIGDSVSAELFEQLSDSVASSFNQSASNRPLFARSPSYHNRCNIWKAHGLKLCFVSTARKNPYDPRPAGTLRVNRSSIDGKVQPNACKLPHFEEYSLGDTMECLLGMNAIARTSIVVINVGLHHNEESSLRAQVGGFTSWLRSARAAPKPLPCLMWLQSLPQHFPTPDGTYRKSWLFDEQCAASNAHSRANLSTFLTGDGRGCVPLSLDQLGNSRQRFNDVTDAIVSEVKLPIVESWRVVVDHSQDHPGCVCVPKLWRSESSTSDSRSRGECGLGGFAATKRRVLDCSHYKRWESSSAGRQQRPLAEARISPAYAKVLFAIVSAAQHHCAITETS